MSARARAPLFPRLRAGTRTGDSGLTLPLALAISLLLHGALLLVTFAGPPPHEREAVQQLEVVLVNAKHQRAPDKAEVIAQANLDGGGNSPDPDARPSTPTLPSPEDAPGDTLIDTRRAASPAPETVESPPETPTPTPTPPEPPKKPEPEPAPPESTPLSVPAEQAERPPPRETPPTPAPAAPEPAPSNASGLDLMNSIAQIARLEAQIDRRLNEYAQRPRKVHIGSRAREHRFAQYVENWRQKVERVGTLNYPDAARGRLYGNLVLTVAIRADGNIERVEVDRSSGHAVLDSAAVEIVRLASPYSPFPPDIRVDTDIIEITRTWTFTGADQLRTR